MAYRVEKNVIYRHFKGNYYKVEDFAYNATNDNPGNKKLVIYRSLGDNKLYVRDLKEFSSEVDHKKYPDAKQRFRFERVNLNKMLKNLLDDKDGDE